MKTKLFTAFVVASTLISAAPAVAHASTNYLPTHIDLNGQTITSPAHTIGLDPSSHQSTSFMPIYYATEVLNRLGITASWDGTTWSLNVPNSIKVNLSNPATGTSEMYIEMNGVKVEAAPKLVAIDPSSKQDTTFVPIYYLEQALNRIGVTSTWDGTNWKLTRGASTVETQTTMAQGMWSVFNATTWDITTPTSMQQAGVNPINTSVNAGQVATWLADWAEKSKGYSDSPWNSNTKTFVPFSLQYESSTDPYTWASENDLFQGTSVSNASSVITPSDATQILSNLKWWLTGDRVVNGVHHLHVPMYGNYHNWTNGVQNGDMTQSQFEAALADATRYYDEITVTTVGPTINITLPNVTNSPTKLAWSVINNVYSTGYGGGPTRTGTALGGTTLHVPLGNFVRIVARSLDDGLMGVNIAYADKNGAPVFNQPIDSFDGQQP